VAKTHGELSAYLFPFISRIKLSKRNHPFSDNASATYVVPWKIFMVERVHFRVVIIVGQWDQQVLGRGARELPLRIRAFKFQIPCCIATKLAPVDPLKGLQLFKAVCVSFARIMEIQTIQCVIYLSTCSWPHHRFSYTGYVWCRRKVELELKRLTIRGLKLFFRLSLAKQAAHYTRFKLFQEVLRYRPV